MQDQSSIGDRLRSERGRLKLSQVVFAEKAGITRNTQRLYESGTRSPDGNYFAAVAGIGVDVAFVLAGAQRLNVAITPNEMALIDRYRLSHRDVQRGVDAMLEATAKINDET